MATLEQLQSRVMQLERSIADVQVAIGKLREDLASRIRLSTLTTESQELRSLIRDNAQLIVDIEKRLAKVLLPEETKMYLEEGEVEAFKSNFAKMKAMMAQFQQLYKNLVAYNATNGQI